MTTIASIDKKMSDEMLMSMPVTRWNELLANKCQVFACEHGYLAKRFNEIQFSFCSQQEAKDIVVDNLFAILKGKYFSPLTEEKLERIQKIVASFCINLRTTLKQVSFDKTSRSAHVENLPDYCIAFRNGVYDFKNDKWFLRYDVTEMKTIGSEIYAYDFSYIIMWYMNFDFSPLPINIVTTSFEEIVGIFKELTKENRNYCFELCYNIAHNKAHEFELDRFRHLCEVLGYAMLQSFSQHFVMLIGSGQNGKNSLFDGCFTNRLVPRPASNDLDAIENDRFITGALENHSHNIFLETSAKKYVESKMIKALTGSMFQTIESKGVSKYSGIINCKYIFAGNDQEEIKFSDTTTGFRRRINIFEIFYHWDSKKNFMKQGDYYDTTFSNSLIELTSDPANNMMFCYLAMLGICSATFQFTRNFEFTKNDWNMTYADVDHEIRRKLMSLTFDDYYEALKKLSEEDGSVVFFDAYKSRSYKKSYATYSHMMTKLEDDEEQNYFFSDYVSYVSIKFLHDMFFPTMTIKQFTKQFKKVYNLEEFSYYYKNSPYAEVIIEHNRTFVLKPEGGIA